MSMLLVHAFRETLSQSIWIEEKEEETVQALKRRVVQCDEEQWAEEEIQEAWRRFEEKRDPSESTQC